MIYFKKKKNWFPQEKGTCPLHVAAGAGQASQVELLLIYGADPGALDSFGKTPADHSRFHYYH
jgi:ankyrin repeat protein